jgi:arylsulfatase
VIIAQAGYFGGWALYMKGGRVVHDYNFFGLDHTKVASEAPLASGAHTIESECVPHEAKQGTGGKSILKVDGAVIAEGHIPKTQPFAFSADEGADVGSDNETMVSDDYKPGATDFKGEIVKVTVAQQ